jgi:hypothetical protein
MNDDLSLQERVTALEAALMAALGILMRRDPVLGRMLRNAFEETGSAIGKLDPPSACAAFEELAAAVLAEVHCS